MRLGCPFSCKSASHQEIENEKPKRWGRGSTLSINGLLFQRSALLPWEGCYDCFRKTSDSGTWREFFASRRDSSLRKWRLQGLRMLKFNFDWIRRSKKTWGTDSFRSLFQRQWGRHLVALQIICSQLDQYVKNTMSGFTSTQWVSNPMDKVKNCLDQTVLNTF